MIESMEYRYCIWDGLPLNESPIFATLSYEHGVKIANRYARRMVVQFNHPPPEVPHDTVGICMVDARPLEGSDTIGCAYLHRPKSSFKRSSKAAASGS